MYTLTFTYFLPREWSHENKLQAAKVLIMVNNKGNDEFDIEVMQSHPAEFVLKQGTSLEALRKDLRRAAFIAVLKHDRTEQMESICHFDKDLTNLKRTAWHQQQTRR